MQILKIMILKNYHFNTKFVIAKFWLFIDFMKNLLNFNTKFVIAK